VFLRETKRPRDEKTKRLKDGATEGRLDDGTMRLETGDRGQESTEGVSVGRCFSRAGRDSREEAQEERGIRHTAGGRRAVRILYVGRIHPEKGLGLLANALRLMAAGGEETKRPRDEETKRLEANGERQTAEGRRRKAEGPKDQKTKRRKDQETDWECVLVGPVKESEGGGGEAFAEEVKQQVEGLPVRFEAPVYDPAALATIYDEADVFVYPSVAEMGESFGIAPLEAMARGVVPVVSDLAVFREFLEPDVNGMVFDHRAPRAAENLGVALRALIGDAGTRACMGVAARQTAERFSTPAIAERYLKLFAETLESGT
jgi:glycosyltransferase involved in cell wall biosynthesis